MPHAGRTKRHVLPLQVQVAVWTSPNRRSEPVLLAEPRSAAELQGHTLSQVSQEKSRWRLCGRRAEHGVCPARSQAPSHGMRLHPTRADRLERALPALCPSSPSAVDMVGKRHLVPQLWLSRRLGRLASGLGCPPHPRGAPQTTRPQWLHSVRPSCYLTGTT